MPAIAFWVRATIRGRPDVVSGKLRAAEAAVAAEAVPKPNGQPPTAYPIWDGERGCWVDDAGKERPSTIPATVQPEQQPEPQPMMEQPPSQPRTPYAHTYTRWGVACPPLLAPALCHFPSWGATLQHVSSSAA